MSETKTKKPQRAGRRAGAGWTPEEARRRYGLADAKRRGVGMQPHELLGIRKCLGDTVRGDMPQEVFAALLGLSTRQLRNYEHGTRIRAGKTERVKIPELVAREALRLLAIREGRAAHG